MYLLDVLLISAFYDLQRQRLREFLIRQQMQRNSIRQEKEAAAASTGSVSPGWSGGDVGAFQQEKVHRAPPPYPQVHSLSSTPFTLQCSILLSV